MDNKTRTNLKSIFISIFLFASIVAHGMPGDLDPTFGVGGKVIDASGYGAYDVAIQPDGKIVVVGLALGGSQVTQITVARYNGDGSPDTTFGGTGRVFIDRYQVAVDVAIQPDGKIVIAGRDPDGEWLGELVRINSNGSLDTSFHKDGIFEGFFLPSISAIQPDGKLLISQSARLFRFNQDGSNDPTFGNDVCRPAAGSYHYPNHRAQSAVQPDGKILAAFTKAELEGFTVVYIDFAVYRCNPIGTLDNTFGTGGIVITPIGSGRDDEDVAHSIAIQTDGKIVVAGQSRTSSQPNWVLRVVRYHPNGLLDTGFGVGGVATMPTGLTMWLSPQDTVAIQSDGKILVSATIQNGSNHNFALVRYNPDGSPDLAFGGGDGITTVDFDHDSERANGMAMDILGRAVVVGESNGRVVLTRIMLDTPLVSVSGRVTNAAGRGIRSANVSLRDSLDVTRAVRTDAFGRFTFQDVRAKEGYIVSVASRRYSFTPQQIFVNDNLANIDFVGSLARPGDDGKGEWVDRFR